MRAIGCFIAASEAECLLSIAACLSLAAGIVKRGYFGVRLLEHLIRDAN
jgi:hypothetical protein